MTPIDEVIALLLKEEGGIVDLKDGAGVTRFGQTAAWLAEYNLPAPLSAAQAADNYRRWMALLQLDQICLIDVALGVAVVDYAVNSHARTAVRALQALVLVTVDGVIGPKTLAAVRAADHVIVGLQLSIKRQRSYALLVSSDVNNRRFAGGWMNRMADVYDAFVQALQTRRPL